MLRLEKASGPSPRARFRWGLVRVPINTCKEHFRYQAAHENRSRAHGRPSNSTQRQLDIAQTAFVHGVRDGHAGLNQLRERRAPAGDVMAPQTAESERNRSLQRLRKLGRKLGRFRLQRRHDKAPVAFPLAGSVRFIHKRPGDPASAQDRRLRTVDELYERLKGNDFRHVEAGLKNLNGRLDRVDKRIGTVRKEVGERFDRARQDRKDMEGRLIAAIAGKPLEGP